MASIWVIEGRKLGNEEWIPTDMTCSKESADRYIETLVEPDDFERDGERFEYCAVEYIRKPEEKQ